MHLGESVFIHFYSCKDLKRSVHYISTVRQWLLEFQLDLDYGQIATTQITDSLRN